MYLVFTLCYDKMTAHIYNLTGKEGLMVKGHYNNGTPTKVVETLFEKALARIKDRAQERIQNALKLTGAPYVGTSVIWRGDRKILHVKPGVWREESGCGWEICCEIFEKNIADIVEDELSQLALQLSAYPDFILVGLALTIQYGHENSRGTKSIP